MNLTANEINKRVKVGSEIFFMGNHAYAPMFGNVTQVRRSIKVEYRLFDVTWERGHFSTETTKSLGDNAMILITDEKHKLSLVLKNDFKSKLEDSE
jgi:hypothetical protein